VFAGVFHARTLTSSDHFPPRETTPGFPGAGNLFAPRGTMIPNANVRHFRLKAALRDLIAAAGGIERAADILTMGKSTVGRWQDADAKDFPSVDAVAALEAESGRADVSRVMAEFAGLPVGNRVREAEGNAGIMASHAEAVTNAAALMAEGALAFSDSHVTPAEATSMDRAAQRLEESIADYRRELARARGEGGLSLVSGGAKA
jgi:hypothetical protein